MRAALAAFAVAAALAASGCHRDSLVVVRLDAAPAIAGVTRLHITSYVGERSNVHDSAVPAADSAIPGPAPFTFSLYVDPALGSSLELTVDARAADGSRLAIGRGSAPLHAGARSDTTIVLGPDDGTSDSTCIFEHSLFDHCTLAP